MAHTTTFLLWTSIPAHRSYTMFIGFLQKNCKASQADDGMPSMGQIFPYVLRLSASDRRWCLLGIQITLLVRLAARMSSRSLTSLRLLPFYPFSCAVVRLRRMGHCWRMTRGVEYDQNETVFVVIACHTWCFWTPNRPISIHCFIRQQYLSRVVS